MNATRRAVEAELLARRLYDLEVEALAAGHKMTAQLARRSKMSVERLAAELQNVVGREEVAHMAWMKDKLGIFYDDFHKEG